MVFLCGYPAAGSDALLLALQGQQNATPTHTHSPLSSSHKCVPGDGLVGVKASPHTLSKCPLHLLELGRGWPGLGLPGPTPLDPSHCLHRIGTVGRTQAIESSCWIAPTCVQDQRGHSRCVIKGGFLLAASAWYQGAQPHHQHQADQDDQEDPAPGTKINKK